LRPAAARLTARFAVVSVLPALRPEHADHRREGGPRRNGGTELAGNGLFEGEADLFRRSREHDDVVGARLEDAPDEAVRRPMAENDDRALGALLHSAVDQEERSI
jgi:hypothetical protein